MSDEHPLKQRFGIVDSLGGRVMLVSLGHMKKTLEPSSVIDSGSSIDVSPERCEKNSLGIAVIES